MIEEREVTTYHERERERSELQLHTTSHHSGDWKMEVFREMQIQSFAFLFGGLRLVSKVPKVRYKLNREN